MRKSVHTSEYRALRQELQQARRAAGLSQRALAARLRVPHSWVAKVESGERRIDLIEFCWFMDACDADARSSIARLQRQASPARSRNGRGGRR